MINIERQVCSLELSKKLKELGVRQNSYFYHCRESINVKTGEERWGLWALMRNLTNMPEYYVSAFTVAELMQMLPRYILHIGKPYFLEIMIDEIPDPKYRLFYRFYVNFLDGKICQNNNISEAAAELLAFVIENGYVKGG